MQKLAPPTGRTAVVVYVDTADDTDRDRAEAAARKRLPGCDLSWQWQDLWGVWHYGRRPGALAYRLVGFGGTR